MTVAELYQALEHLIEWGEGETAVFLQTGSNDALSRIVSVDSNCTVYHHSAVIINGV